MLAILWRDLKTQYTKAFWLVANFCQPLFYLCFFALLFSRSMRPLPDGASSLGYIAFFLPGLAVLQSFAVFQNTYSLVHLDKRLKILETIKNTRTTEAEYFFAKAVSAQILAYARALLVCLVGAVFFGVPLTVAGCVSLCLVLAISNMVWYNLGFVLGYLIETEEKRDIFQQLFSLPVMFLSTVYYSGKNVPVALGGLVRLNPLTAAANISRDALLGDGGSGPVDFYFLMGYLALSCCAVLVFFRLKNKLALA